VSIVRVELDLSSFYTQLVHNIFTCFWKNCISNVINIFHSLLVSVYTVLSALPAAPTNLTAPDVTSDSVILAWNSDNTKPVKYYIIQFKCTCSSDYSNLYDYDVQNTTYKVLFLQSNKEYEFRIIAVNDDGQSQPSTTIIVTTHKGKLLNLSKCNRI